MDMFRHNVLYSTNPAAMAEAKRRLLDGCEKIERIRREPAGVSLVYLHEEICRIAGLDGQRPLSGDEITRFCTDFLRSQGVALDLEVWLTMSDGPGYATDSFWRCHRPEAHPSADSRPAAVSVSTVSVLHTLLDKAVQQSGAAETDKLDLPIGILGELNARLIDALAGLRRQTTASRDCDSA